MDAGGRATQDAKAEERRGSGYAEVSCRFDVHRTYQSRVYVQDERFLAIP
jgi:hypothetical protein